jgi:hypothetical protein
MQSRAAGKAADAQGRAADASIAEQQRQFDLIRQDSADYRNIGGQALNALGSIYGYGPAPQPTPTTPASSASPFAQPQSGSFGPIGNMFAGFNPFATEPQEPRRFPGQPPTGRIPGEGGANQPLSAPNYSAFFASPDYTFRRGEGMKGIENSFAARGGAASGNALRALTEFNSNLAAGEFGNYFNRQAALAGIGQTANNMSANAGMNAASNIGNALMRGGDARASGITGSANAWTGAMNDIGGLAGYMYGRNRGGGGMHAGNWGYGTPPIWGG